MIRQNIILVYVVIVVILISGCSTKIYMVPEVKMVILDKITEKPIKNVALVSDILYSSNYASVLDKNSTISNQNGMISYNGLYNIKWHLYPLPIISEGKLSNRSFLIIHPQYNSYILQCVFTTLNGKCNPLIVKIENDKKNLKFECDGCSNTDKVIPMKIYFKRHFLKLEPDIQKHIKNSIKTIDKEKSTIDRLEVSFYKKNSKHYYMTFYLYDSDKKFLEPKIIYTEGSEFIKVLNEAKGKASKIIDNEIIKKQKYYQKISNNRRKLEIKKIP